MGISCLKSACMSTEGGKNVTYNNQSLPTPQKAQKNHEQISLMFLATAISKGIAHFQSLGTMPNWYPTHHQKVAEELYTAPPDANLSTIDPVIAIELVNLTAQAPESQPIMRPDLLERAWHDYHLSRAIAEKNIERIAHLLEQRPSNHCECNLSNHFAKKFITGPSLHEHFLSTLNLRWTIEGILPETSRFSVIFGPPGTFKSFIALNMGGCISEGIDWHGRAVNKKFVLYAAAEGQAGTLKRLVALQKYHGVESFERFALLPLPCLLDCENELKAFIEAIRTLPQLPGVIFIDTLARSMSGDENSTSDMGKVVIACGKISEATGAQIVLVHHTGKDESRGARGAIALTGATDSMFKTSKSGERQVVFCCERQKDDEPFADMVFNMEVVETGYMNADGEHVCSLVPVLDPEATATKRNASHKPKVSGARRIALNALIEITKHGGRAHLEDWRKEAYRVGISPSSTQDAKLKAFKRAVAGLMDSNLVACEDDYYWSI
jgi:hypothetical protein